MKFNVNIQYFFIFGLISLVAAKNCYVCSSHGSGWQIDTADHCSYVDYKTPRKTSKDGYGCYKYSIIFMRHMNDSESVNISKAGLAKLPAHNEKITERGMAVEMNFHGTCHAHTYQYKDIMNRVDNYSVHCSLCYKDLCNSSNNLKILDYKIIHSIIIFVILFIIISI